MPDSDALTITILRADLEFLINEAVIYRSNVASGDISGFDGSREDELAYMDDLIKDLRAQM